MEKLIKRGKLYWLIKDNSVIVADKLQATVYHAYGSPVRVPIERLKKIAVTYPTDKLDTWEKVITLTQKLGMRGYGTTVRQSWFEES